MGDGTALLATVRGDGPPRIHPISLDIVDGRLYAFILKSAKRTDLVEDGRYALHSHQDPAAPDEFELRGHAHRVMDEATRARAAANWPFEADEWPPRYELWVALDGGA